MKKLLSYIIIFCILFNFSPAIQAEAAAADTQTGQSETTVPETEAKAVILPTDKVSTDDIILYSSSCCVMDAETGNVLYYKNMDDRHYPASITKVLTGLLLIENAELNETITFSQDCWDGLNYYNDMNIGILDGEQLSVEAALHAILLSSANEVCNGAARYVSGSVDAFCDMMNERAAALGCTNTHFVNPNGLQDEKHYTSAYDMALISRAAIQNPTFRKITGTYEYRVKETNLRPEGFVLGHKHRMLMYTNYHYDACIGGKTGYTEAAKNTLVTYAKKNGMTLVCVVMENSDGHIYPDTIKALDYCFDNYQKSSVDMSAISAADTAASWPTLPFTGFDIDSFSTVCDHTGYVIVNEDETVGTLNRSFAKTEAVSNMAPYRTALYALGTIRYTSDEQASDTRNNTSSTDWQNTPATGFQPIYSSLSSIAADSIPMTQQTAGTPKADNVQAFVQLKEASEEEAALSATAALTQRLTNFIIEHLSIAVPAIIIALVILSFLIVWLRSVLKRRHHRRKYEQLRRARMQNLSKNKQ